MGHCDHVTCTAERVVLFSHPSETLYEMRLQLKLYIPSFKTIGQCVVERAL